MPRAPSPHICLVFVFYKKNVSLSILKTRMSSITEWEGTPEYSGVPSHDLFKSWPFRTLHQRCTEEDLRG